MAVSFSSLKMTPVIDIIYPLLQESIKTNPEIQNQFDKALHYSANNPEEGQYISPKTLNHKLITEGSIILGVMALGNIVLFPLTRSLENPNMTYLALNLILLASQFSESFSSPAPIWAYISQAIQLKSARKRFKSLCSSALH